MSALRATLVVAALLCVAGCATHALRSPELPLRSHLSGYGSLGHCSRLLEALDHQVAALGVKDAEAVRVPGYPYLAVDRFAASWAAGQPVSEPQAVAAWLAYARDLASEARAIELKNAGGALDLPALRAASGLPLHDRRALPSKVAECAETLERADFQGTASLEGLRDRAVVPDNYRELHRLLGLYPLTSVPFAYGVRNLHDETRRIFDIPLDRLPLSGKLHRYVPGDSQGFGALRGLDSRADAEALLEAFAPVWEVETKGPEDAIGRIVWVDGRVSTAPRDATVYQYLSRAWWIGQPVLQLNYVAWFSARPKTGAFDLLGGHLDGLTWRVTLDASGRPLVADVIHNCGCYHMVFPVAGLALRNPPAKWEEPVLVPAALPAVDPARERIVLRIEAGTHYLQRIYRVETPTGGTPYARVPYDELRSIARKDGTRRSMFGPDGIVAGTERGERWLFWPMGVPNAGAMRSRGHHAIAFVGTRHFDDPYLIERYFVRH